MYLSVVVSDCDVTISQRYSRLLTEILNQRSGSALRSANQKYVWETFEMGSIHMSTPGVALHYWQGHGM
jgi:hypothetical protein